ncbi:hypothetical protein [Bifidobacterium favimelis]|uniref:Cell surface protein n=1 Tax=Bifidobacterium favimelis TaxID=3122979 RepID=A0ABU8ZP42_9BIFI
MKGNIRVKESIGAFVCAVIVTLSALLVLPMTTAAAVDADDAAPDPRLTVHVVTGGGQDDSMGHLSDQDVQSDHMKPAGSGYVFKVTRLDGVKFKRFMAGLEGKDKSSFKHAARTVSDHIADYRDSSGKFFYGSTDSEGIVATKTTPSTTGVWLEGADYLPAEGLLSGGKAARFDGSASDPSFWLLSLVGKPKGVQVSMEPVLVELPIPGLEGRPAQYDVDVTPKMTIHREGGTGAVVPARRPGGGGKLAASGLGLEGPVLAIAVSAVIGLCLTGCSKTRESQRVSGGLNINE